MLALKKTKSDTVQELLRESVLALQQAKIETASLDARLLLQHVLGASREQLLMRIEEPVPAAQAQACRALTAERARRRPMAQLLARREFWGRDFIVTADTLDPRPDSETLVEAVMARFPDKTAPLSVLDLGTGTGCLLLTLLAEYPFMRGVGADVSPAALAVAKENAVKLGLQARAEFLLSDWFAEVRERFDLIVSNPPYIETGAIALLAPEVAEHEPKLALDGGPDGLAAYRAILAQAGRHMRPGAQLALEIGLGQQQGVAEIAAREGLAVAAVAEDLGGIARCMVLQGAGAPKQITTDFGNGDL